MSKSFPEWWKHGQKVRTASDGILTLNIAEDAEYWLTNNAGKEVSVFSMDILGPASVPEACRMTTDITELAQNPTRYGTNSQGVFTNQTDGEYVSYLDFVALVEALEKAQQRIAELENYAEAEAVGADRAAEDSVYWMKRCKELESRTVKLPHRNLGHPKLFLLCPFPYYDAEDMEKALAAAGIKVEAE